MKKTTYTHKGFSCTLSEVCKKFCVSKTAVEARMGKGMPFEQAIVEEEFIKWICIRNRVRYKAVSDLMQKTDLSLEMAIRQILNPTQTSERRLPNPPNTKSDNEAGREF